MHREPQKFRTSSQRFALRGFDGNLGIFNTFGGDLGLFHSFDASLQVECQLNGVIPTDF
jgi:hypothetical protein